MGRQPTFGERVRHFRELAGLKQAKLARQVGVTQSAVQQWETDSTEPTHAHLEAIAKACGVELRIFFGDIGEADDVERAS